MNNDSVPDEGLLLRCNSYNQWQAICNYDWECVDAIVACRQLGFNDSSQCSLADCYACLYNHLVYCNALIQGPIHLVMATLVDGKACIPFTTSVLLDYIHYKIAA